MISSSRNAGAGIRNWRRVTGAKEKPFKEPCWLEREAMLTNCFKLQMSSSDADGKAKSCTYPRKPCRRDDVSSKTAAPCVLETKLTIMSEQNVPTHPYDFGFSPAKRDDIFILSIYLSIYPSIHPSIYLSIHPSIHPSIHLSIYIYIYIYR